MTFVWRMMYGLPPVIALFILNFYQIRRRFTQNATVTSRETRLTYISFSVIALWFAMTWVIIHWHLWSDLFPYTAFEIPDKSSITSPTAINDKNVVVGYLESDDAIYSLAFVYAPSK
jgi:hypothetical protein